MSASESAAADCLPSQQFGRLQRGEKGQGRPWRVRADGTEQGERDLRERRQQAQCIRKLVTVPPAFELLKYNLNCFGVHLRAAPTLLQTSASSKLLAKRNSTLPAPFHAPCPSSSLLACRAPAPASDLFLRAASRTRRAQPDRASPSALAPRARPARLPASSRQAPARAVPPVPGQPPRARAPSSRSTRPLRWLLRCSGRPARCAARLVPPRAADRRAATVDSPSSHRRRRVDSRLRRRRVCSAKRGAAAAALLQLRAGGWGSLHHRRRRLRALVARRRLCGAPSLARGDSCD